MICIDFLFGIIVIGGVVLDIWKENKRVYVEVNVVIDGLFRKLKFFGMWLVDWLIVRLFIKCLIDYVLFVILNFLVCGFVI